MEVVGSIYTGVSDEFYRGLCSIARCVKAGNHDLGVVMAENKPKRLGNLYGEDKGTDYAGNVWDIDNIAPTITTSQGAKRAYDN